MSQDQWAIVKKYMLAFLLSFATSIPSSLLWHRTLDHPFISNFVKFYLGNLFLSLYAGHESGVNIITPFTLQPLFHHS